MALPNFIVIGAPRAGTTSLYFTLGQHPQVHLSPVKEPRYFAFAGENLTFRGPGDDQSYNRSVTSREVYEGLFRPLPCHRAIGEMSTCYLLTPAAPERIHRLIPHTRLIAILRQPADRAYSNYLLMRRLGFETCADFRAALADEPRRMKENWAPVWYYRQRSRYCDSLRRYQKLFPPERIRIFLFEDLLNTPEAMLQDLYRFLELDEPKPALRLERHNDGGIPRSVRVDRLVSRPHPLKPFLRLLLPGSLRRRLGLRFIRWNNRRLPLDPELRNRLTGEFREDILELQDLTGRDLSHWLQPVP